MVQELEPRKIEETPRGEENRVKYNNFVNVNVYNLILHCILLIIFMIITIYIMCIYFIYFPYLVIFHELYK